MENYYNILHLDQTATMDDIKNSYLKIIKDEKDNTKIKSVKMAYDTLSNYHKRKKYDDMLDFSLGNVINKILNNSLASSFFSYKPLRVKNNEFNEQNKNSNDNKSYFFQEKIIQNITEKNGKCVLKEEHYINDNGKEHNKKFEKVLGDKPINLDLTVLPSDTDILEKDNNIEKMSNMRAKRYKINRMIKYK